MPREHRKRGKRKRNDIVHENNQEEALDEQEKTKDDLPSWIEAATPEDSPNIDAPFGFCDPDVKAYFRTVDKQLKEWQELGMENKNEEIDDPNLERRMFFAAALTEMQGKELQLATDPDTAVILERMIHSMDDLARRIFTSTLTGSIIGVAKHRFGSHVLETLFEAASLTIDRECRNIFPAAQSLPQFADQATMGDLISQICREVTDSAPSLLNEPFGSHVLQRLVILLVPSLSHLQSKQDLRSKRSAGYRAKVGPMKSIFDEEPAEDKRHVPLEYESMALGILKRIRDKMSANEVRALAADKVGCPSLRILISLESASNLSNQSNSLMDSVLMGMIDSYETSNDATIAESDYIGTLLRDATASHLFQTVIQLAPEPIFGLLWSIYFVGKLNRLAVHPVANFVVATAFGRLDDEQLRNAIVEMKGVVAKCFKQQRLGPVTALIQQSAALNIGPEEIVDVICNALEVEADGKGLILQILGANFETNPQNESRADTVSVQGVLLLQAILRLPSPHNEIIVKSFEDLPADTKLALSHNATSSRVVDAMIESPTLSRKSKRAVVLAYIGNYERLVDDRIGSRVGDRFWAYADPYLKEKIARSLIPHQQTLSASYYGKFFARKLQLTLLQRKPEEWKAMQSRETVGAQVVDSNSQVQKQHNVPVETKPNKDSTGTSKGVHTAGVEGQEMEGDEGGKEKKRQRKRKREEEGDEIDALFAGVKENRFGKVSAQSSATPIGASKTTVAEEKPKPKDLESVLNAIKAAPKNETTKRRKG